MFSSRLFILTVTLTGILFCLQPANKTTLAQSKVTFNINLKPQLKDSIFVPGRDVILLKGDLFPLSPVNKKQLKDTSPVDSIYSVTISFPSTSSGKRLTFNYIIRTPDKTMEEGMPRHLDLRGREIDLDALYFDSFAW